MYGISLVVTVASIILSRLPEKLAIILMRANDGYDVANNTIILDSSVRPLDCIGTHSENSEAGKSEKCLAGQENKIDKIDSCLRNQLPVIIWLL